MFGEGTPEDLNGIPLFCFFVKETVVFLPLWNHLKPMAGKQNIEQEKDRQGKKVEGQ